MRALELLSDGGRPVSELLTEMQMEASHLSQHLSVLRRSGLVSSRREGNTVLYRLAGVVAAIFGGSNLQVSGPTGAMVVVLLPIVNQFGPGAVATVAVLAGVIVIPAGLLGLGGLVSYIPWPVIEGFTLGIGVIIAVQQIPLALNTPAGAGDNAVVIATLLVHSLGLDIARIGALPSSLPIPSIPNLTDPGISALASVAFAVAALAALESLLAAKVADGMADDISPTEPNRELFGQGVANITSGLFGGMPATGAIARTAVSVRSGARTRVASLTHAVVLALTVYLAGVLIVTAGRMINLHTSHSILRSTRSDALVFIVTALTTVALDLVLAVQIGVAVAAVLALRHVARSSEMRREEIEPEIDHATEIQLLHEQIAVYRIDGPLFFAGSRRFLDELIAVSDVRVVVLRMSSVRMLDATGANALAEIITHLRRRHIDVLIKGLRTEHLQVMTSVGELKELERRNHVFAELPLAIEHARKHVLREINQG